MTSLAKACRAESIPVRYSTIRAAIAFWVVEVRKLGEDAGSDLLAQLAREMKEMLELQFGTIPGCGINREHSEGIF